MIPKDFQRILATAAIMIAACALVGLPVDPQWSLSLGVLGVAVLVNFAALAMILVSISSRMPKIVYVALVPLKVFAVLLFLVAGALGLIHLSTLLIAFNAVFVAALLHSIIAVYSRKPSGIATHG